MAAGTQQVSSTAPLSRGTIAMLAVACGVAVAKTNYAQPLPGRDGAVAAPVFIHAWIGTGIDPRCPAQPSGSRSCLPLGDVVPVRRLLTVTIILQAVAMAGVAFAPDSTSLLLLSLMVGVLWHRALCASALCHAADATLTQRGRVTALLAQGRHRRHAAGPKRHKWRNRFP